VNASNWQTRIRAEMEPPTRPYEMPRFEPGSPAWLWSHYGPAGAMYVEYSAGLSVAEVADRHGLSSDAVWRRFRQAGLPLRPRPRPRPRRPRRGPYRASLAKANAERTQRAGEVQAKQAQAALRHVSTLRDEAVLTLRAENPHASLAQLGRLLDPPVSKDVFTGMLRRALRRHKVTKERT
jgi:transposase-like protein